MIGQAVPKLKRTLYRRDPVRRLWQRLELGIWQARGRPSPPPARFKQRLVRAYAESFGLEILVETGTSLGDMIYAHRRTFRKIYSIELERRLFLRARDRFRKDRHVHLVPGDSGDMLALVLPKVDRPCLFWLDAHAMVGGVRGRLVTPVARELDEILGSELRDYVLLIDDARLFTGAGYPTVAEVRGRILEQHPGWVFEVADDVMRAHRRWPAAVCWPG